MKLLAVLLKEKIPTDFCTFVLLRIIAFFFFFLKKEESNLKSAAICIAIS